MDSLILKIKEIGSPVLYETGGNQEFISANVFKLTGYYAEEIRHNRDLFPGMINPEDYIETNFKIKNWHKNNEPGILNLCFRFLSSNGSQVWIEDHLIGLQSDDTKYMQGLMLEITPQKRLETNLLHKRTESRERTDLSDKEKEKIFLEIETALTKLKSEEQLRHKHAAEILNMSKEHKIKFSSLPLDFLNAR